VRLANEGAVVEEKLICERKSVFSLVVVCYSDSPRAGEVLQTILTELAGADGVRTLRDAPAPNAGTAHSVADSVSFLKSMMLNSDTESDYTESAYGASSDSGSSEEQRKPHKREHKKPKKAKAHEKKKKEKDKDNEPKKNTCPHCKRYHRKKPHRVEPDKCMWNKKYKGYRFKSICNELEVDFKPCIKFLADLGCKIARRQHIKQTLRCLRDSDKLFLDSSITLAEDERTSLAKADESNKKRIAINAAHTKRGITSIGFAQRGRNAAYSLGSAFNRTIKKSNKNKHVSLPHTTEYINTAATSNPSW